MPTPAASPSASPAPSYATGTAAAIAASSTTASSIARELDLIAQRVRNARRPASAVYATASPASLMRASTASSSGVWPSPPAAGAPSLRVDPAPGRAGVQVPPLRLPGNGSRDGRLRPQTALPGRSPLSPALSAIDAIRVSSPEPTERSYVSLDELPVAESAFAHGAPSEARTRGPRASSAQARSRARVSISAEPPATQHPGVLATAIDDELRAEALRVVRAATSLEAALAAHKARVAAAASPGSAPLSARPPSSARAPSARSTFSRSSRFSSSASSYRGVTSAPPPPPPPSLVAAGRTFAGTPGRPSPSIVRDVIASMRRAERTPLAAWTNLLMTQQAAVDGRPHDNAQEQQQQQQWQSGRAATAPGGPAPLLSASGDRLLRVPSVVVAGALQRTQSTLSADAESGAPWAGRSHVRFARGTAGGLSPGSADPSLVSPTLRRFPSGPYLPQVPPLPLRGAGSTAR
jgi:hypothetical protein